MKRIALIVTAVCLCISQADAVAIFWDNGSSMDGWTEESGAWMSVDGAIVRTGDQVGGKTHALASNRSFLFDRLTFPVTLTYDIKVESDNGGTGEVWSGIGISAPYLGASNIEDGAVIAALRASGATKGLHILVGGRQWISQENNLDWKPDTWYTVQVTLSNPDFATNKVDINASIIEKGGTEGAVVNMTQAPASGNAFVLGGTSGGRKISAFSRSSANGLGGMRYYDNIVLEAANIPGARTVYQNDGTDTSGFTAVAGVFESVDGAIVRTDPVRANTTQGFMLDNVADLSSNSTISLEYDIKVESLTTQGNETWSGIGLFTPAATASNIEDGAVIMTIRESGVNGPRGLHALVGGRAWADNTTNNLVWKADTWYRMSVTVTNANLATGHADVVATLSEIDGPGAATQVMVNAPPSSNYTLTQKGIGLFSRSGTAAEGGKRSFDNIKVIAAPKVTSIPSFVDFFESLN